MPREPLRQEQIPRHPVHRADGRVAKTVKIVGAIKPRPHLPRPKHHLHAPPRDAPAGLRAKQRGVRLQRFATLLLVAPESLELAPTNI